MSTPANNLPAGGQAPTDGTAQVANPTAPAAPAAPAPAQAAGDPAQPQQPQPQQPAAPQAGTQVTDPAELQKLLNAARAEAATYRTKAKEYEDKDKTELQKATERATELEKRTRLLSVQVAAGKLGIVDPEAAAALLPADTPDDQVEAKLTEMLAARPWLKGQPTAPVITTPPGNPAKTTTTLTLEVIKTMSQAEINARWAEVSAVLAAANKPAV